MYVGALSESGGTLKNSDSLLIKYVYVCGPLTDGGRGTETTLLANIGNAVKAGSELYRAGFIPHIPHLDVLWSANDHTMQYEDWLKIDFAHIRKNDALLALPGKSEGKDKEIELAKELVIPVFYSIEYIVSYNKAIQAFIDEALKRKKLSSK